MTQSFLAGGRTSIGSYPAYWRVGRFPFRLLSQEVPQQLEVQQNVKEWLQTCCAVHLPRIRDKQQILSVERIKCKARNVLAKLDLP